MTDKIMECITNPAKCKLLLEIYSQEQATAKHLTENSGTLYMQVFTQYFLGFAKQFREYCKSPDINIKNDMSGFSLSHIYLSDEEPCYRFGKLRGACTLCVQPLFLNPIFYTLSQKASAIHPAPLFSLPHPASEPPSVLYLHYGKDMSGIILELKTDSTLADAIRQIRDEEYCQA